MMRVGDADGVCGELAERLGLQDLGDDVRVGAAQPLGLQV